MTHREPGAIVGAYPGGLVGFAVAAALTHALLGYTLGHVLFGRPRAGVVGGLLADSDLVLSVFLGGPFAHRGVTHSALAAGLEAALAARSDRRVGGAVGAGYLSHLAVDATTPMGIMLAYPLSTASASVVLSGHAPPATAALWGVCLVTLLAARRLPAAAIDPAWGRRAVAVALARARR